MAQAAIHSAAASISRAVASTSASGACHTVSQASRSPVCLTWPSRARVASSSACEGRPSGLLPLSGSVSPARQRSSVL
jgi:hypothetical protein